MHYIRFSPSVETPAEDEAETIAKITQTFKDEGDTVAKKEGSAKRTSHAKATALLKGVLTVHGDLPTELAQGLFSEPSRFEALIRFAQGPGEVPPDRISTHRGMAVKLLGVSQDHILESRE